MAIVLAGTLHAFGANAPAPAPSADDIVKLGKVDVDERGLGRPYFYAEVPGFELLSPFSEKLTQVYAAELQRQRALLTVLIPELASTAGDPPQSILLDDQPPPPDDGKVLLGQSYAVAEGVLRQSLNAIRGVPATDWKRTPTRNGSTISWSRAGGPDHTVFYTSIYGFDYVRQSAAGDVAAADAGLTHIFPIATAYEHRHPRWPTWVEEGINTLGARFYSAQTLSVFLLQKVTSPPFGLKVADIFAPLTAADPPARIQLRQQAACVLATWALAEGDSTGMIPNEPRRDAYWRLAARASREPVTEEVFAECFGSEGWGELLGFWIRMAAKQGTARGPVTVGTYWPAKNPVSPPVTLRRATRAELARIKGEYEWRIAREFATAAPELARQCLDQAGRRLRKAYADGEREPRFLAVHALYEAEVATPEEGCKYVEEAAAMGVLRPRLYVQQARYRENEERATPAGPGGKLSLDQVRRVLEPLDTARTQRPALGSVYQMMATLWLGCAALPAPEDFIKLDEGLARFPRDPALAYNLGLLHARVGDLPGAAKIATQVLPFATEGSEVQKRLRQLLAAAQRPAP